MSSWPKYATVASVSILAGLGAGYLLGLITARWLWREERRTQRLGTGHPPHQTLLSPELTTAIAELTAELGRLRQAVETGSIGLEQASRRSMRTGDSTLDFVSARGDNPESEDESEEAFFDVTTPSKYVVDSVILLAISLITSHYYSCTLKY